MRDIISILAMFVSWIIVLALTIYMDSLIYTIGLGTYILALILTVIGSAVITGSNFSFEEEES